MNKFKNPILDNKSLESEEQISGDRQLLLDRIQEIERRRIYTEAEVCRLLNLSKITLFRMRKAGKISFHRAASKIIYTRENLDDYLASTKQNAFGGTNQNRVTDLGGEK